MWTILLKNEYGTGAELFENLMNLYESQCQCDVRCWNLCHFLNESLCAFKFKTKCDRKSVVSFVEKFQRICWIFCNEWYFGLKELCLFVCMSPIVLEKCHQYYPTFPPILLHLSLEKVWHVIYQKKALDVLFLNLLSDL